MLKKSIAFIGSGKMATALISCIYNKKIVESIIASDRNSKNLIKIKKQFKIKTTADNKEAVKNSDIVFICVKPQDIDEVLEEIKNVVKNQLIVSIAAGIKIGHIDDILKSNRNEVSGELKNQGFLSNKRIIRVMPNINCLIREMAAGFSAGKYVTKEDISIVSKMLNSGGIAFFLKEDLLDVVGAISGSGPAFFAYFIKSIAETGIKKGLPKEIAFKLAAQTALGTGKLLIEKNISSEELISMVASKKGITIEGLKVLKRHKVKNILIKTINAAVKKARNWENEYNKTSTIGKRNSN